MSISVQCTGCKKSFKTKDEFAGRRIKCPGCGQVLAVPAAEAELRVAAAPAPKKTPAAKRPPAPVAGEWDAADNARYSPPRGSRKGRWILLSLLVVGAAVGTYMYLYAPVRLMPVKPSVSKLIAVVSDVSVFQNADSSNLFLIVVTRNVAIGEAIDKVEAESAEPAAVAELVALIKSRRKTSIKSDTVVCQGAIHALGEFGTDARPAISYLEELSKADQDFWPQEIAMALAKIRGLEMTIRKKGSRN